MVMKFEVFEGEVCGGFFGGKFFLSIFPRKNSLEICHRNFTTFFTLKFRMTKEICHLVLTLGAISRNKFFQSSGVRESVVSKRVALADVPLYPIPERGYIRMFPGMKNRKEGTFGCSRYQHPGMRAHLPKPPFYETTLLFPLEKSLQNT